jgi:hypothetical protein
MQKKRLLAAFSLHEMHFAGGVGGGGGGGAGKKQAQHGGTMTGGLST